MKPENDINSFPSLVESFDENYAMQLMLRTHVGDPGQDDYWTVYTFEIMAVIVALLWMRFILMMKMTKTFGPMLRIIEAMFIDVGKFLVILVIILIACTSITFLLFSYDVEEYDTVEKVFFNVFGTSLANYEMSVFTENEGRYDALVGEIILLILLILNSIVLTNFIIAILAETFSKLMSVSLGLYYDGVIQKVPAYNYDERYGGLIIAYLPVSIFSVFLIPVYMLISNEEQLKQITHIYSKIIYIPLCVIMVLFTLVFNMILTPFAYIFAILKKIQLLRNKTNAVVLRTK